MAHAQVAVFGVGPERHEENVHILVGQQSAQFRKLHVVADQNADAAGVGVENTQAVTALDRPVLALVGGDVNLLLLLHRAVAAHQIGDVVNAPVLFQRHGAADDVDVVAHRHVRHGVADFLGEAGQVSHRFHGIEVGLEAHQRRAEEFRQHGEIGPVIGQRIDEELHLAEQVFHRARAAHAALHHAQAHHRAARPVAVVLRLIEDIVPLQQGGVAARAFVLGQVLHQQALDVETVGQLEGQNRIVNGAGFHFGDVLGHRHLVRVVGVAGQTAAGQNRPQVFFPAQILARLIEPPAQAVTPVLRVHEHVQAVQRIALAAVRAHLVVGDQVFVAVRVGKPVVAHLYRQRRGDQRAVVLDHQLPFREQPDQGGNGFLGPGTADVVVHLIHQPGQRRVVFQGQLPQTQASAFFSHGSLQ